MKLVWAISCDGIPLGMLSLLQTSADCCLAAEGVTLPCGVGLHLVNDTQIRMLNRDYRGVDRETDVLSFPQVNYPNGLTAGKFPALLKKEYDGELGVCMLGDIFLSLDRARAQAEEYGHSLEREAAYLVTHGICHLMGYDHMIEKDQKEMRAMEEKALNMIGVNREGDGSVSDEALLKLAVQAMERSYAPYSKFRVGACLLCEDGRVFQGCNIENASFGLTNCAERTAHFKAVSEGTKDFTAIAIAADDAAPWPCGACRQVLNEFAPNIKILVTWDHGKTSSATLSQLLPHGFGPKDLQGAN